LSQVAARAQRASVTEQEIVRYREYNDRHGAKYTEEDEVEDLEEW